MSRHHKPKAVLLTLMAAIAPVGAAAQDCALKLSEFSDATIAYADDVGTLSERLTEIFATFALIEAAAVATPETCPAGLDDSRAEALALELEPLNARSEALLDCGQFFSQRILADIGQAESENDGQLILRLGAVQERIFRIEKTVLDAATQATFVGLRAKALVAEHDALANRCQILGDIYD